jgi:hypothetical protein
LNKTMSDPVFRFRRIGTFLPPSQNINIPRSSRPYPRHCTSGNYCVFPGTLSSTSDFQGFHNQISCLIKKVSKNLKKFSMHCVFSPSLSISRAVFILSVSRIIIFFIKVRKCLVFYKMLYSKFYFCIEEAQSSC